MLFSNLGGGRGGYRGGGFGGRVRCGGLAAGAGLAVVDLVAFGGGVREVGGADGGLVER